MFFTILDQINLFCQQIYRSSSQRTLTHCTSRIVCVTQSPSMDLYWLN